MNRITASSETIQFQHSEDKNRSIIQAKLSFLNEFSHAKNRYTEYKLESPW
jgi:hypothetical protein